MGLPLTGIIFTLELTHDFSFCSRFCGLHDRHLFTALVMHRSILTEKIAAADSLQSRVRGRSA